MQFTFPLQLVFHVIVWCRLLQYNVGSCLQTSSGDALHRTRLQIKPSPLSSCSRCTCVTCDNHAELDGK